MCPVPTHQWVCMHMQAFLSPCPSVNSLQGGRRQASAASAAWEPAPTRPPRRPHRDDPAAAGPPRRPPPPTAAPPLLRLPCRAASSVRSTPGSAPQLPAGGTCHRKGGHAWAALVNGIVMAHTPVRRLGCWVEHSPALAKAQDQRTGSTDRAERTPNKRTTSKARAAHLP